MTGFVDGGRSGIFAAISTFGATATGSSTFGFGNGAGSRRASGLGVGIFATSGWQEPSKVRVRVLPEAVYLRAEQNGSHGPQGPNTCG